MDNITVSKSPRTAIAKAKRLMELQALYKQIKPEIDQLKAELLEITKKLGVVTLKTEDYTISRVKKVTPEVTDFETLKAELEKNNIPYGTKEVFADYMSLTFKKLIEDGRKLEGLEAKESEYVAVRLAKGKEVKEK
jgi:glutamate-1-semialdehyde aminotransferase